MSDNPFAIFVSITLQPGVAAEIKPIVIANAEASVRDEEACQQFQVLMVDDEPDTFYFYEVYDTAAGLDTHRLQPHYKKFAEAIEGRVVERSIKPMSLHKGL